MISAIKDAVTSRAAQAFVNKQIARYGSVEDLKIDSGSRTVEISCLLHGEASPIHVKVENYAVESSGAKKFLTVTRISASRPWLQNLLIDHVQGRRVELPSWAAAAL